MKPKFNFNGYKQYTSFIPLLLKCALKSKGPVIEMGMGFASTPLLHWITSDSKRKLYSYEDDLVFFDLFHKRFQNRYHRLRFVEDWDKLNIEGKWGLVFIDQNPLARAPQAIKFKDKADLVVIHDSDHPNYGFDTIWPHYKYRYNYISYTPNTTVVSNFDDLTWLNDIKP